MKYQFKFNSTNEIKKSPDGKYFATIGNYLVIWDAYNGKKINTFGQLKEPYTMNFSATGKLLAVKNTSGKIAIYEMENLTYLKSVQPTKEEGCEVYFTPNERYLVSADWNGNIYIVEIESGEISLVKKDSRMYTYMEYLNIENKFIIHSNNPINKKQKYTRIIWEYPFDKNKASVIAYDTEYNIVKWSQVNRCFAVVDKRDQLRIMDEEINKVIKKVDVRNRNNKRVGVEKVAWSSDGTKLAVIADINECQGIDAMYSVRVYEYRGFELLGEYFIPNACYVEFSKDNKQLLIGSWKNGYCININDMIKGEIIIRTSNGDVEKQIKEKGLSEELLNHATENELLEALFSISDDLISTTATELDCDESKALRNVPELNRLIYLVYWFSNETSEGGLTQYIFNSRCDFCVSLKDAFIKLDMPQHEAIIEKAVQLHQKEYKMDDPQWDKLNMEYEVLDENPLEKLLSYIEQKVKTD